MPHTKEFPVISLLVPQDWEDMHGKSLYKLSLIKTIQEALADQGFQLNLVRLRDNETASDLQSFEEHLSETSPAGVILARVLNKEPVLDLLHSRAIPFVIFGHNPDTYRDTWTDIDNRAAFWLTTRKCIDSGHRRIALLNGPAAYSYAVLRAAGYKTALDQAGIPSDPDLILNGQPTFAMGSVMASFLLQQENPPTALVCATDEMAMGAMYACIDLGLEPGTDISIIGYGNSEAGAKSTPRLATAAFDLSAVGRLLAKQILSQFSVKRIDKVMQHQLIPVSWVDGGTLGPAAHTELPQVEATKPNIPTHLAQRNAALNRAQQVVHAGDWRFKPLSRSFNGSPEFCSILGLPRGSEISMSDLKTLILAEDKDKFEQAWTRALDGRPFDVEARFLINDIERALQWRGEFICNSEQLAHAEGAVQDVSEAATLRRELQLARNEAIESSRAKDLFLANMSHEIRTPIHAILGLTDLVLRQNPTSESLNSVKKIARSGKNLLNIINDILLISKVESNALEVEDYSFDLQVLVDDLSATMDGLLADKDLTLILPTIDQHWRYLRGDPTRLSQVLLNLLGNAAKFTAKGEIELSIEALPAERIGNEVQLRFSVRDTGIGIPAARLSSLFTPFAQADASISRNYGGTGLGLTIVDKLVRLMGGEVEVSSRPEIGSTFSFVLHFETSAVKEAHLRVDDQLRVLIVDDSPTDRLYAAQVVLELGWSATVVESATEALNELVRSPDAYDLMLLDFHMPGMSGLEAAQQVRTSTAARDMQILMLSSRPRHELDASLSHFVDGFLQKPLAAKALLEAMAGESALHLTSGDSQPKFSLEGLRILCVDDAEINLELLVDMLSSLGAETATAMSGARALEILAEGEQFDLVLSDIQMPEMDGFELTERIHQLQSRATLPVIGVSAGVASASQPKADSAGMQGYLEKPFDIDQLVNAIELTLSGNRKTPAQTAPIRSNRVVFNVDSALKNWSDRTNFTNQLDFFLKRYADLGLIPVLVDDLKLEEALQQAHKLKGVAGVLGLERLADAAKVLELELREGEQAPDLMKYRELAAEVASTQDQSIKAVSDWLASQTSMTAASEASQNKISPDQLLDAILAHDPVATDEAMACEIEGLSAELLGTVQEALSGFDFERAAMLLRGALASGGEGTQNSADL